MQPLLPSVTEFPLFDVAHTQRIEALAREGLPAHTLMQRAGWATAQLAMALAPHASTVWVAAGPGNNGGDGLEAATHLHQNGWHVIVTLAADTTALPADAAHALQRARSAGVLILHSDAPPPLAPQDLAIDALLGIGASRPAQGALAQTMEVLNAQTCPVLAIDSPSGLDANTGQVIGAHAVVATHTLALLTLKPGLFTASGRDHAGRVWFDALGTNALPATPPPQAWLAASRPTLDAGGGRPRLHAQHKGSFGDVAVVGGASGMVGAALLAARAALAAGAGRVFVQALGGGLSVDTQHPELMCRDAWSHSDPQVLQHSTAVCGCGGGDAVRTVLPRLLSHAGRLVLDADALNALAADTALQSLLRQRAARALPSVLTPHPLEAARLLQCSAAQIQANRLQAAQRLAAQFQCTVVLKGSGSIIAAPHHTPRINATGNAALATAGTGDVLAGWLGGLWAQEATDNGFHTALRAVREHGAAAEPPPRGPLCASDLISALQ